MQKKPMLDAIHLCVTLVSLLSSPLAIFIAISGSAQICHASAFVPPATVIGYNEKLTFCLKEGQPSSDTTTLADLTEGGTRIVVLANYFTGCSGGRVEARWYADVEANATKTYGARVLFVTNLIQSSTATNCAGWQTFANFQGASAKPTILYSSRGGPQTAGSKHLSYTFFDNLHPQYLVVDGDMLVHYYESNDLEGKKFRFAPGTKTYDGGEVQDTTCGGGEKTTLNYWNVDKCKYRGYDKVLSSLPEHIMSLKILSTSPSASLSASPSPSSALLSTSPSPSAILSASPSPSSASLSTSPSPPALLSASPSPSFSASPSASQFATSAKNTEDCVEPSSSIGSLDTSVSTITVVPAFGVADILRNATSSTNVRTIVNASEGRFSRPRDLKWHPLHADELWVANSDSADFSILTLGEGGFEKKVTKLSDRAKYHYMPNVSSFSFNKQGRFATCQESTNTYDGLTARGGEIGNRFMGPSLFDSDPKLRVTQMGDLCSESQLNLEDNTTCFLRHIDMLHSSPMCQGLVSDPELYKCGGGSLHKNVYWAFDGWGGDDQTSNTRRKGMLMRFDFERDHGGCNSYLCADHGEAEVRRYEDVVLTREPGVVSHMVIDDHRDLYISDAGAGRVLRVDADSGVSARSAINEFQIYSSTHLHFNYRIWSCTLSETLVDGTHAGLLPADRGQNFMPSGIAVQNNSRVLYLTNHISGNIIALDMYTAEIIATVETGLRYSLAGLLVKDESLYVLDQRREELLLVQSLSRDVESAKEFVPKPRRPYPKGSECNSKSFEEATVGEAIEHDPGYMNIAIPYDYGKNVPCHDSRSKRSNLNLDALLMSGHTCHRCLPEPCLNGGKCSGIQESGFTCTCPDEFSGDMCQIRRTKLDGHVVGVNVEPFLPNENQSASEPNSTVSLGQRNDALQSSAAQRYVDFLLCMFLSCLLSYLN